MAHKSLRVVRLNIGCTVRTTNGFYRSQARPKYKKIAVEFVANFGVANSATTDCCWRKNSRMCAHRFDEWARIIADSK